MSEAKRSQLIADGKLNADGSRKERCPTCGTGVGETLTKERYVERVAPGDSAVAPVQTFTAEGVSPVGSEEE